MTTNRLYYGDNLNVLRLRVDGESVDLGGVSHADRKKRERKG